MGHLLAHKTREEIFAEAEIKYLDLIKLEPDNKELKYNLAVTYFNLAKHEEAKALWQSLKELEEPNEKANLEKFSVSNVDLDDIIDNRVYDNNDDNKDPNTNAKFVNNKINDGNQGNDSKIIGSVIAGSALVDDRI